MREDIIGGGALSILSSLGIGVWLGFAVSRQDGLLLAASAIMLLGPLVLMYNSYRDAVDAVRRGTGAYPGDTPLGKPDASDVLLVFQTAWVLCMVLWMLTGYTASHNMITEDLPKAVLWPSLSLAGSVIGTICALAILTDKLAQASEDYSAWVREQVRIEDEARLRTAKQDTPKGACDDLVDA